MSVDMLLPFVGAEMGRAGSIRDGWPPRDALQVVNEDVQHGAPTTADGFPTLPGPTSSRPNIGSGDAGLLVDAGAFVPLATRRAVLRTLAHQPGVAVLPDASDPLGRNGARRHMDLPAADAVLP